MGNVWHVVRIVGAFMCLFTVSCTSDNGLREALALSGGNRNELEEVLEYYKNDTLKLRAANFLITNMMGHFSLDSQLVEGYTPFYDQVYSLAIHSADPDPFIKRGIAIDSLWKAFNQDKLGFRSQEYVRDLTSITAGRLIKEIDLAFKAWRENTYTKDYSFEDFCEYILPYRRAKGVLIDDARETFYNRHHQSFFNSATGNVIEDVDSILHLYEYIHLNYIYKSPVPIFNAATVEKMGFVLCNQRCWYNSLLLSSLGVPVAVDYVPTWGNRNYPHSWNVVILDGKSYAFDAFWNKDLWKYKRIYNNKVSDTEFGKFRIAKVYREMYSHHMETTLLNEDIPRKDIPSLFLDYNKKDVTDEYVETVSVKVDVTTLPPEGASHAYLCLFGYEQWHPVQFGKIENKTVEFSGMGKDVLYLPAYYKQGMVLPAGSPFLLKSDGTCEVLVPQKDKERIAVRNVIGSYLVRTNSRYMACMRGSTICGIQGNGHLDTLCSISDTLPLGHTIIQAHKVGRYRYVRLQLPSDSIALGDISFYTLQGKIPGVKLVTALTSRSRHEQAFMLTDDYGASVFRGTCSDKYVDFDLGSEYTLTSIGVTPYLRSELTDKKEFELMYWDQGWKSLGKKRGNNSFLLFDDVPKRALLFLKDCDRKGKSYERIFLYNNGEVDWR